MSITVLSLCSCWLAAPVQNPTAIAHASLIAVLAVFVQTDGTMLAQDEYWEDGTVISVTFVTYTVGLPSGNVFTPPTRCAAAAPAPSKSMAVHARQGVKLPRFFAGL